MCGRDGVRSEKMCGSQGWYVTGEDYLLPEERKIECVSLASMYRYLGLEQVFKPDHKAIRVCLM